MNPVTHVLKKDVRHSRVLLAVWLLLVVLQFVLIGSGASPGDRLMQALYSTLSTLVPLFQALVLIVIIPHVVQDEPLVGTTAFWFTRPISRGALLESKTLFALVVLLIPPLIAEVIVLAANGATGHDIALAVPEIVMQQLALILDVAVLAVVTSNFGRFAVLGAVVVVAMILLQLAIFWTTLFWHPENMLAGHYSLTQSRSVAGSALTILLAGALIAHQYLTRRTKRTVAGMFIALALVLATQTFWPWDFLTHPVVVANDPNFNAAPIKVSLGGYVNSSDVMTMRGQGAPAKNISAQLDTEGAPKGYILEPKDVRPRLTLPDGRSIEVQKAQNTYFSRPNSEALEYALGGTPIVNASDYFNNINTSLFTVDAETYQKYVDVPLKLSADIDFVASRYVLAAEMPLEKGARYDHGSEHDVITDVLHQPAGVDIVLRERALHLLFKSADEPSWQQAVLGSDKIVYLLLNKKRGEAVLQKQENNMNIDFGMGSQRLVNKPVRLSFGQSPNNGQVTPDLTPEWLADATLVRLELTPSATFSKELTVDAFKLSGQIRTSSNFRFNDRVQADPAVLHKIALPPNATKDEVRKYLEEIMVASRKQVSWGDKDPQVGMLAQAGPENLDVLIEFADRYQQTGAETYFTDAIERVARPQDEALILEELGNDRNLADLVVKYGWQNDARATLLAGLDQQKRDLPASWIKAVAMLEDPSTYPALEACLVDGNGKQQIYDAIKGLPGIDLSSAVDTMWKKAKYGNTYEVLNACGIAAENGHADAVETAARIMKEEKNQYERKRARQVITKYTPATGDDDAVIAWVESNRGKLTFDPQAKKFAPQK